jgi:hypothetical protein
MSLLAMKAISNEVFKCHQAMVFKHEFKEEPEAHFNRTNQAAIQPSFQPLFQTHRKGSFGAESSS